VSGDAPHAPPGWYQDPDEPGVLRYWDGSVWSSEPPAVPPPGVQVNTPITTGGRGNDLARRLSDQPGVFWGAVAAAVGMGIGTVGTWATALGFISIAGSSVEAGQVVLGLAVVGLLGLWARALRGARWPVLIALVCGGIGAAISGIDLHKLSGIGTSDFFGEQIHLVHPGWGIYLTVGSGTALALLSLAVLIVGQDSSRSHEPVGATADDQDVHDDHYGAGIAFVVIVIAIGVVVAVSHVATPSTASGTENVATSTATTSPPAETSTVPAETESVPTATTATTPAASNSSEALGALERYWEDIGEHNYTGAYIYLAPGASGLSESEFISSEQHAGIQDAAFHGRVLSSSDSGAKIEVVSLVTHDQQFGCRDWSGSYEMTDQSDMWLIEKAVITPRPCA
jgi:hypothetical protein